MFLVLCFISDKNRGTINRFQDEIDFLDFIWIKLQLPALVLNGDQLRIAQVSEARICIIPVIAFFGSNEFFEAAVGRFPGLRLTLFYGRAVTLHYRHGPYCIKKFFVCSFVFLFVLAELQYFLLYLVKLTIIR